MPIRRLTRFISSSTLNFFDRSGANIRNFGGDLSSSQLLHQQGGTLEGIDLYVGIHAALEAERRIGVQTEALGRLAHPDRVEIGALDEYVGCRIAHARIQPAVNARNTHGFRTEQIIRSLAVSLRSTPSSVTNGVPSSQVLDHDPAASIFAASKRAGAVPVTKSNEIGNVHEVVFWGNARSPQAVLHPFGRRAYLTILDRNTRIARCGFAVFHLHIDLQIAVIDGESAHVGPLQFDGLALALR